MERGDQRQAGSYETAAPRPQPVWKEGRLGLVDLECGKLALKEEHASLLFCISSQWCVPLLGWEREGTTGRRLSRGFLKSVFRR